MVNTVLFLSLLLLLSRASLGKLNSSNHTSNHAVILSSSRYWFNYRHVNNALAFYHLAKKNGIPEENIVLMLADDIPTNSRNPFKNAMYYQQTSSPISSTHSLYDLETQIDYRGEDVTVDSLRRVLLGKATTQASQRVLHTDEDSNVLVYWTGHGGDSFFKFQDVEEITAKDIRRVLSEMTFKELLFVADTCQAFTLGNELDGVNNVYMIGSSLLSENSYAHHGNMELGVSVMERYTYQILNYVSSRPKGMEGISLYQGLMQHVDFSSQGAHIGRKRTQGTRPWKQVPMSDFFAAPRKDKKGKQKSSLELISKIESGESGEWWDSWKAYSDET